MTVGFGQQNFGLEQYQHRVINSGRISDATQNWGIAGLATNTLGALVGGEEGRTLGALGNLFGGIADIRAQHEVNRYEETSYSNIQQNSSWGGSQIMPWGAVPQQQFVQPYQQPQYYQPQYQQPQCQNNQQQGMMQMLMGMMMMMMQMMMQMFGMGGQQNNQGSFAMASSGNNGSFAMASSGNPGYAQPMNYATPMPYMTNGYQTGNYQNYQHRDITSGHISEATQNWGIAGLAANTLGSLVGGEEGRTLGALGNLFGGIADIRAMGEVNTMHQESFNAGNFLRIF